MTLKRVLFVKRISLEVKRITNLYNFAMKLLMEQCGMILRKLSRLFLVFLPKMNLKWFKVSVNLSFSLPQDQPSF